jgi:hypothetical protein
MLCDGCAMTDNEVFAAVQALVAAGEYLDDLPTAPLVQVQLPEGRRWFGRGYRRGSPQHLAARAAGGVVRLPPLARRPRTRLPRQSSSWVIACRGCFAGCT